MFSNRLGTANDFHWGFKPVFRYKKPQTYSAFIEKENKNRMHLFALRRLLRIWKQEVAHLRKRSKVTVEPFTKDH